MYLVIINFKNINFNFKVLIGFKPISNTLQMHLLAFIALNQAYVIIR